MDKMVGLIVYAIHLIVMHALGLLLAHPLINYSINWNWSVATFNTLDNY